MSVADGRVLIMAGGTGGHIFPGLALAEELRQRGIGVHWLGALGAMECHQVPARGIGIDTVRIRGLRGNGLVGWLLLPFRLMRAVMDAVRSFRQRRPDCAVSFGGYAAGPGGLAARMLGVPLIVHEQNRVPGMTNRFLARMASEVFQAFEGTFPDASGALTCGNPVRPELAEFEPPATRFKDRFDRPPSLLVTGGSQGASSINRWLPGALARIAPEHRPVVLHQAGRGRVDETRAAYRDAGVEADVVEFIEDMAAAYAAADLAVCRSGALTISELAVVGLGALLIPFPHAVDDHQARNAEVLERAGAARILSEDMLDEAVLSRELEALLTDRPGLLRMAEAAYSAGTRDSASRLADACGHLMPRAGVHDD